MSKIGTNQMAVNAQKAQAQIQRQMTKIMEKLSTGQRINKPNDDPAGLSISTKMTAQIKGFQSAAKNINDAIAMVQQARIGQHDLIEVENRKVGSLSKLVHTTETEILKWNPNMNFAFSRGDVKLQAPDQISC